MGKIQNISLNGLSFRYLAEQRSEEEFIQVDIFLTNNGFHLHGVPCTIIYNEKESTSNSLSMSAYRCGLKFEPLKGEQQVKLELFLNTHTRGKV